MNRLLQALIFIIQGLVLTFIPPTLLVAANPEAGGSSRAATELLFLTWSDYIDPQVISDFERKFNAKVKQIYFETDDARNEMLVETNGRGYDLVMVNNNRIGHYQQRGWLLPLDTTVLTNLKHIAPQWLTVVPDATDYGVPYAWGTTGIVYRADLVPEPIYQWKQLFQPAEALRGKIMMAKSASGVIGMALKALGYSANSANPQELAEAEKLLLAQKPYVKMYSYLAVLDERSELATGTIVAAMVYNGDALAIRQHNANITYVAPEEGGEIWIDYLAVLKAAPHRQLAFQFINFLHEPANALRNALFTHFATPNQAAEKQLPADFLENQVIYPSAATLENSELLTNELPPRAIKQRNSIFSRLLE